FSLNVFSQTKPTQTVEERLIRVEEGQKNLEKRFEDFRADVKQENQNLRTEIQSLRTEIQGLRSDLATFMTATFVLVVTAILSIVGFVLWDRRTFLAPIAKETKELSEKVNEISKIVLKKQGILQ
ncbi:hypothetical protein IT568_08640, partial [bacterium]|nr:hypothetical protein [bacterium]